MRLISEVLVAAWGDEWRERFEPSAPKTREFSLPYIRYSLQHREPTEKPQGNRRPMLRSTIVDREHPDHAIDLFGQLFDVILQFDCYALSADQADELAERLEEFMLTYTAFLKAQGVHEIFFLEQLADDWDDAWSEDAHVRSLRYYARMDRVIPVSTYVLEDVTARVNLTEPS